jgi:hypothetical protein
LEKTMRVEMGYKMLSYIWQVFFLLDLFLHLFKSKWL